MAQSLELRAARLVAALEKQGTRVASLVIADGEIRVTFAGSEQVAINEADFIDWRRVSKHGSKTQPK